VVAKLVTDYITDIEYLLAKNKAILNEFPNCKVRISTSGSKTYIQYSCKSVNSKYTGLDFVTDNYGQIHTLYVQPYCLVKFNYNNVNEVIKIQSSPARSRLAYTTWENYYEKKRKIKFSRVSFNIKNHQFKDDMLNECRIQILDFIKKFPDLPLDKKHLEPRLEKLLIFT
jgi:hypothetical protein